MSISVKSTSISIKSIAPASPDEWDLIWRECPYSTYFHSREWSEIWGVYTKGEMEPQPKVVEFSDGMRALLPLTFQKSHKGLVGSYISSPAGTYGGWISSDELNVEHAAALSGYLTKRSGNLSWKLNPYDRLVFESGVAISRDDETHALDLRDGFEVVFKGWRRNHTYGLRKAQKGGVTVKLAETRDDWLAYYHAYEDSLRRWGDNATSRYGWGMFEEMLRRNSQDIKLWLAVHEEQIISGVLCVYANKHADAWHAATFSQYFDLRPETMVMYEAIRDACERGFSWFDFNPSGGHEGVKTFKERFGAQPLPCPDVINETRWARLTDSVAVAVKRGIGARKASYVDSKQDLWRPDSKQDNTRIFGDNDGGQCRCKG